MVSPVEHLTQFPVQLEPTLVALFLCAGLTAYSALAKANRAESDYVVIPSIGGGLGHLAGQIAISKGYKVIAVDSVGEKRKFCTSLDSKIGDVLQHLWPLLLLPKTRNVIRREFLTIRQSTCEGVTSGYGVHGVVCTAGAAGAYEQALRLLRNGGPIICVGLAEHNLPISPFETIVRGLRVIGSSAGTAEEMQELLEVAPAGDVIPNVEAFGLESLDTVVQALAKSQIAGRVVVKPPRLALLFNE